MQRFGELLDALSYQPSRNEKLRLMVDYLRTTPDPDRGFAWAALTGGLSLLGAKPAALRALGAAQLDETLFALSYDYVGDLAETLALIWRQRRRFNEAAPSLSDVVERLGNASPREVPTLLSDWLDRLDATGRWALLKLVTGGLRVGVSARLAKMALAQFGEVELDEIEELWHGRLPPYADIFQWLSGNGTRPSPLNLAFRPFMLAHPLEESDLPKLEADMFRAEWKWDGIRVQLVADSGERRIYSRGGEEIGRAFPDILDGMSFVGAVDGELLIGSTSAEATEIAPFRDLQQRLNRKNVTPRLLAEFPAHVRLYDLLAENGEDLRPLAFDVRRARLEAWHETHAHSRFSISPLIPFSTWAELAERRTGARAAAIEGLMVKRGDSSYLGGRVKGAWFKWKRQALTVDAVMMYAQRGHGKRSSFYSDYTFGCWRDRIDGTGPELVPVGKAYSGFTDTELKQIDKWVRDHTTGRFGPVREVEPGLVLEVAFDAVQRSSRHKSGLALRFPRISRLRWDKPVHEADRVEALERLIV